MILHQPLRYFRALDDCIVRITGRPPKTDDELAWDVAKHVLGIRRDQVEGVCWNKDGTGLCFKLLEPMDHIIVRIDTGDKIPKIIEEG